MKYPSEKDDWKKFETNTSTIALNVLHEEEMEFFPAYISKHSSNRKKQIIFNDLNGEGWHYLVVKKLSVLLREITLKHDGNFYCLKCLYPFRTENTFKSHEKVCKNKDLLNCNAIPKG